MERRIALFDPRLLKHIITNSMPDLPNTKPAISVDIPDSGLPMGTVILGEQGSGKSTEAARQVVDYAERHPTYPIVIGDPSGNITNDILSIIENRPPEIRNALMKRIIYDEMGNTKYVVPMPEFHEYYGSPMSKQIRRVVDNLEKLEPNLVSQTPIMGGLSLQLAPELFKVITAITPRYDIDRYETWQITEAKRLLASKALFRQALAKVAGRIGSAYFFFKENYLDLDDKEIARRTYALATVLDRIEDDAVRARVGASEPGYTFKEIIDKGLILIVNGQNLIDHSKAKEYLFVQMHSMLMAEINKRTPANPADKPVLYQLDELYELVGIPGMAAELSRLSPVYRSRKLQFVVILQNLSQLTELLRPHIWNFGNFVCFTLLDFDDAFKVAQQLFPYVPKTVKAVSKSETQQDLYEPDRGQYLQIVNQLRSMKARQCIYRRQVTEANKDKFTYWVEKTREVKKDVSFEKLSWIKDALLKVRGKEIKVLLTEINSRKLGGSEPVSSTKLK
jgi:hypothetical protein